MEQKDNMPPPFSFSLPDFAGRIFPKWKVTIPDLTLEADFSDVRLWGENAIMSYNIQDSVLSIYAWSPDPKTPGFFQIASFRRELSERWRRNYEPDREEIKDNQLVVYPRLRINCVDPDLGTWALVALFVAMGIGACIM